MKGLITVVSADPVTLIPDTDPVPTEYGAVFNRNGRTWRVASRTDTFIIATDVQIATGTEPENENDIIKVML